MKTPFLTMKSTNLDTQKRKYLDGLTLFTESVLKPDPKLRQCAHNQDCYEDLMAIREDVLDYLTSLRNMTLSN